LSADLLITDVAPIPALIQRLGRLNRKSTPEKKEVAKFCVVCPLPSGAGTTFAPYSKAEIEQAKTWIDQLLKLQRPLNQRDLANFFGTLCQEGDFDIAAAEERAWFFGVPGKSGLWRTRPGFTRDAGYTISVVLKSDLKTCASWTRYGEPTSQWLRNHEVAIPIKDEIRSWSSIAGIRVAPDECVEYDYNNETREGTGAKWKTH
jgi:CRISPR-associated endonuclease/helicase Cas3